MLAFFLWHFWHGADLKIISGVLGLAFMAVS